MGKANTRNQQLRLALQDEDLRTPAHDEIMHWLSGWVRNPENVRGWIKKRWITRENKTVASLSPPTEEEVHEATNGEYKHHWLDDAFKRSQSGAGYGLTSTQVEPWSDEPEYPIKFHNFEWECWLRDRNYRQDSYDPPNGLRVGCVDLVAWYKAGVRLTRTVHETYETKFNQIVPASTYSNPWEPVFSKTGERYEYGWEQNYLTFYFEVKSQIPSIGEVMRQLQLYRSTASYKQRGCTAMVLVAPPNNEAASVCRDHNIHYLEYRRSE